MKSNLEEYKDFKETRAKAEENKAIISLIATKFYVKAIEEVMSILEGDDSESDKMLDVYNLVLPMETAKGAIQTYERVMNDFDTMFKERISGKNK